MQARVYRMGAEQLVSDDSLSPCRRFALPKLDGLSAARPGPQHQSMWDRWVLSRLACAVERVNAAFTAYAIIPTRTHACTKKQTSKQPINQRALQ